MKISLLAFLLPAVLQAHTLTDSEERTEEGVVDLGDGRTYKYSNTVSRDGKTRTSNVRYTDNSVHTSGIRTSGGGTVRIGDGRTRTHSSTVTRDGRTHSTNVRYTDNSVVANGISHSGDGTVNIGQENQPGKWWDSGRGDLNIANGNRGGDNFRREFRDTYSEEDSRLTSDDANTRGSNANEDQNDGNDDRSKRGIWDVKVDTKTDVNWRQNNLNYRDNSVTSNNNRMHGNGNMNIANGDRSKRHFKNIHYTHKDNSIWVRDAAVHGNGNINIGNGDRSKRDSVTYNDNSVHVHQPTIHGNGEINIANGRGRGNQHGEERVIECDPPCETRGHVPTCCKNHGFRKGGYCNSDQEAICRS